MKLVKGLILNFRCGSDMMQHENWNIIWNSKLSDVWGNTYFVYAVIELNERFKR